MISIKPITKLTNFFSQFKPVQYKKHEVILQADETPSSVFYIKSGYVRAYRISETGEELTLMILQPSDFFPITYGINNIPNTYYLESITPLEVYKSPKELFTNFLKQNPDTLYELTSQILTRFGGLLTRMEYLVISRAYTKVAATLLMCANNFGEQQGSQIIVRLPLTHKDIANLAGITRETTCLEMKKLEQKGVVERSGRLLVVKNMKMLEEESSATEEQGYYSHTI